jgi:hypothetical protein
MASVLWYVRVCLRACADACGGGVVMQDFKPQVEEHEAFKAVEVSGHHTYTLRLGLLEACSPHCISTQQLPLPHLLQFLGPTRIDVTISRVRPWLHSVFVSSLSSCQMGVVSAGCAASGGHLRLRGERAQDPVQGRQALRAERAAQVSQPASQSLDQPVGPPSASLLVDRGGARGSARRWPLRY